MEDLRQALGVDTWSLDGISYGTYVGERYGLAHPSHVSKLVLDSVVPQVGVTDLGVWVRGGAPRVALRLRHRLPGRPWRRAARPPGDAAVRRADVRQHRRPDVSQVLERAGGAARGGRGHPKRLNAFLAAASHYQRYPASLLDQGLHASTLCADWRYPWGNSAAPLAGRAAKLRAAVARIPAKKLYPFDRRTASGNGFVQQCLPWAPTRPTPTPRGKLRVRALLVEGDHDLSTQLTWARRQLALTRTGSLSSSRVEATRCNRARRATPAVTPSRSSCSARSAPAREFSRSADGMWAVGRNLLAAAPCSSR